MTSLCSRNRGKERTLPRLLSGSRQIKARVCEEESSQFAAHVRVDGGGDRVSGSGRGEAIGTQATEYDRAIHARDGRRRSKGG